MFFLDKLFGSDKNSPSLPPEDTPKDTPPVNEGKDTSFFSDLYEGAKNKVGPIADKLSGLAVETGKAFDKFKEETAKTINDLTKTDVIQTETPENDPQLKKRDWEKVDLSKDPILEEKPLSEPAPILEEKPPFAAPAPSLLDDFIEKANAAKDTLSNAAISVKDDIVKAAGEAADWVLKEEITSPLPPPQVEKNAPGLLDYLKNKAVEVLDSTPPKQSNDPELKEPLVIQDEEVRNDPGPLDRISNFVQTTVEEVLSPKTLISPDGDIVEPSLLGRLSNFASGAADTLAQAIGTQTSPKVSTPESKLDLDIEIEIDGAKDKKGIDIEAPTGPLNFLNTVKDNIVKGAGEVADTIYRVVAPNTQEPEINLWNTAVDRAQENSKKEAPQKTPSPEPKPASIDPFDGKESLPKGLVDDITDAAKNILQGIQNAGENALDAVRKAVVSPDQPPPPSQDKKNDPSLLDQATEALRNAGEAIRKAVVSPDQPPPPSQDKKNDPSLLDQAAEAVRNAGEAVRNAGGRALGAMQSAAATVNNMATKNMGDVALQFAKGVLFSREDQNTYRETLYRISGNDRLAQLIDALIPFIVNSGLKEGIRDCPGWLQQILEREENFVQNLAQGVLLKIASNIALNIENKFKVAKGTQAPDVIPHLTYAVLSEILGIFKRHFEAIEENYQDIHNLRGEEKQAAIQKLFDPLVDEILSIGLPNGAADLPIISLAQNQVFSQIKLSLREAMHTLYQHSLTPKYHQESDLLVFKGKGGEGLKELVHLFAKQGVKAAKKACETKSSTVVDFLDPYLFSPHASGIKAHLADDIKQVAKSKNPNVQWIFSLLDNNLESFCTHILATLVRTSPYTKEKNVAISALKHLMDIGVSFFTELKIPEEELERIEHLPPEKAAKQRQKLFAPFTHEFLRRTGLEGDPLVERFKDHLPLLLEVLYKEGMHFFSSQKEERAGRDPIFNEDSISSLLLEQQKISGLEVGCGFLAHDIREVVLKYIQENQEDISRYISTFAGHETTTKGGEELAEAIASVLGSSKGSTKVALDGAENLLKNSLFKVFYLLAANNKEQFVGRDQDETKLIANGLHRVVALLTRRIPTLDARVQAIRSSTQLSQEEKEKALNRLFIPLAREVLQLGGRNKDGSLAFADALPISDTWKPFIMNALETSILPTLLGRIYLDLTSVHHELERNEEELGNLISSAPAHIVKITDYIAKYVPFYLKNNADKITEMVMEKGSKYFGLLSEEEKSAFNSLISKNITVAATNKDLNPAWEAIASFAKGFITKGFLGAAKNLDKAEKFKKTPDTNPFLINLLMGVMDTAEGHFKRISALQEVQSKAKSHMLSHKELLEAFHHDNALHKALEKDLDPNATEQEKKAQRLEHFFKPLAKNLLNISGMDDATHLPLPDPMRKSCFKMLEEEILPEILMGIYEEALKPQNIDKILINVIDALELAGDTLATTEVDEGEPLDRHQRALNEQIGSLIKSLVATIPESASSMIFSIRKINAMSAQKVGDIIRRKTNATNLLEVISILLDGIELKAPDVNDNRTPAQIDADNRRVSRQLQEKMTDFLSSQIKKTVKNTIQETWDAFQKKIDDGVKKYLGSPGMLVKNFLDRLFNVVMTVILPIFEFLIFIVGWKFFELHLRNKSAEIISNAKMPIQENLAFGVTEAAINSIQAQIGKVKKEERRQEARAAKEIERQRLDAEHIRNQLIRVQSGDRR